MHVHHKLLTSGIILLTLGLLMGIGWYFAHAKVTTSISDYEIKENLVVDSPNSKGYYAWEQGNAIENPNYYVYYLWNITNYASVLVNGSIPTFEQVGPYFYRYIWYNRNASFSSDGTQVTYNLIEDYIYDATMSAPANAYQDIVINMNPAYIAILQQTQDEGSMIEAATLPFIGSFIDFLTGEFVQIVCSQFVPPQLTLITNQIYAYLNVSNPEAVFYEQWANATSWVTPFQNMLLSPLNNNESTNLPFATVSQLFNASVNLSLLNTEPVSIMTWLRTSENPTGPEAQSLISAFGLTQEELNVIALWRNTTFINSYVTQAVMAIVNSYYPGPNNSITDAGWVQYVSDNFTNGNSFVDVYGAWYPQFPAPFEAYPKADLTVALAKDLLYGPYGLVLNIENFGPFGQEIQNFGQNFTLWGFDASNAMQAYAFFSYLSGGIGANYSEPFIQNLISAGQSGLFIKNTVDYWLWRCNDPIVAFLLGPEIAVCALQNNNTVQAPSTTWTGKDDINKLNSYISWRNQTQVNYWAAPVLVNGTTDDGQFAPHVQENQELYVWDESFIKTVTFHQTGKEQISGIDTYVYVLDDSAFEVSTLYTNTILGFANESASNQGVPIYLSNWDYYGMDPGFYSNYSANGTITPAFQPNSTDVTTLYVEPTTGSTIQADMKLQVNVYFTLTDDQLDYFTFGNTPSNMFYPLVKIWQKSTIGDADAKKLRDTLVFVGPKFNTYILWSLVAFGALLAVIGVILIARGAHKHRHHGYKTIQ